MALFSEENRGSFRLKSARAEERFLLGPTVTKGCNGPPKEFIVISPAYFGQTAIPE
jgi:hypothetical protein